MPKMHGRFCEKTLASKRGFDRRSFRWKKRGRNWILVGCPKGEWTARSARCKVGTRGHKLLVSAPRGACRVGHAITKG